MGGSLQSMVSSVARSGNLGWVVLLISFLLICAEVNSWNTSRGYHQNRSLIIMATAVLGLRWLIKYVVAEENTTCQS